MAVSRVQLEIPPARIPHHLEVLLDETAGPLSYWQGNGETKSFVPADYVLVYDALCALRPQMTEPRPRFLEWGSGLGVVTLLAAALGWQAQGIEIQPSLIEESRRTNDVFGFQAAFHEGSFFPSDATAVEKLEHLCAQSNVIYVYPWPDQEVEIFDLFDQLATPGTWFLAYYGVEDIRVFQKQG